MIQYENPRSKTETLSDSRFLWLTSLVLVAHEDEVLFQDKENTIAFNLSYGLAPSIQSFKIKTYAGNSDSTWTNLVHLEYEIQIEDDDLSFARVATTGLSLTALKESDYDTTDSLLYVYGSLVSAEQFTLDLEDDPDIYLTDRRYRDDQMRETYGAVLEQRGYEYST